MIDYIRMSTREEREQMIVNLYEMDLIDRRRVRELIGIDEFAFDEKLMLGPWLNTLFDRFESLSCDFLSRKLMEQVDEIGEY